MIRQRQSKYVVEVYDPTIGRKRHVGTRPKLGSRLGDPAVEARALEHQVIEELERRRGVGNHTVDELVDRWIADKSRMQWEASTANTNRYAAAPLREAFGDRDPESIERDEASSFALEHPRNLPVARAVLNYGLHLGWRRRANPFQNLGRDLGIERSRGRRDLVVLTEDELYSLADNALEVHGPEYGQHFRACILFAAYTCVRPGELFALRPESINHQALEVEVAWQRRPDGPARPKNKQTRTIILPAPAAEAIAAMPRMLRSPWLFSSITGKQLSRGSHRYAWASVAVAAKRTGMDFYELRHLGATQLLERGVSAEDVAFQMGHTDGGDLVRSTYGHPSDVGRRARLHAAYGATPLHGADVGEGSAKVASLQGVRSS